MSYDQAEWHYGGNFPEDLPPENGGTHIGMFLAWTIMNGLEGEEHQEDCPESIAAVRARRMTGRQFLFKECDGKFGEGDLNEEGNAFAKYYYSSKDRPYLTDYARVLSSDLPDAYYVEDTWENYDKIASVISERFNEWRQSQ
jgi:hypothetical protein